MRSIVCSTLLLWLATICTAQKTPTSDENAIRQTASEWSQSANLNSLDKWMTFYAEDASVLPFNAPLVKGKNNIRQYWSQLFSKPGWHLSFVPTKIEISKAGDIAYEIGTAELTLDAADGHPTTTQGKYVVAWRKNSNQQWKAVADIFNTDK